MEIFSVIAGIYFNLLSFDLPIAFFFSITITLLNYLKLKIALPSISIYYLRIELSILTILSLASPAPNTFLCPPSGTKIFDCFIIFPLPLPVNTFHPSSTVSTHSVVSLNVMHGTSRICQYLLGTLF